ncbi:hypothetical protein M407DRAFT_19687 [Tulasnella calospora MUT 4182]|uniref:RRM domain-containing protein n=1 Tax=Tulasnella calospora MUT 4182 TaxID=1051891 RepID=A0A0C3QT73_9AGAM|nr:hypothetical protein M407DRAFT_19687 [Tulasnella calospora MUT 4182]
MPSAKGKAEREENDGEHGPTLFVSSISFSTTPREFEVVFADFLPVRHAFVVTHKDHKTGQTRGKGVGIIALAVKEDAEDAIRRFGSREETLRISGRTLHLEWGKKGGGPTIELYSHNEAESLLVWGTGSILGSREI